METWRSRAYGVRIVFALALLMGGALPASAQMDTATARELFREARALMKAGNFAEACPKLEESLRLDHGMGTQFNLAHCWEKEGRTASAWAMFLDVAAAARAAGQARREDVARERAASIEPSLSRLRIVVDQPATGQRVLRDGQELGAAAWGTAPPVDPGLHTVEASAPGYQAWRGEVRVPPGGTTVEIAVPQLSPRSQESVRIPVGDTPGPGPAPTAAEDGSSVQRTWAWVTLGLGAVGVGVGTGFGLAARSAYDEARNTCRSSDPNVAVCQSAEEAAELQGYKGDGDRYKTISIIGFAAGGLSLATGLILYLTDDDVSGSDVALQPLPVAGAEGLSLSLRF